VRQVGVAVSENVQTWRDKFSYLCGGYEFVEKALVDFDSKTLQHISAAFLIYAFGYYIPYNE
jgi:predicted transcriptional regulator of viral defense system